MFTVQTLRIKFSNHQHLQLSINEWSLKELKKHKPNQRYSEPTDRQLNCGRRLKEYRCQLARLNITCSNLAKHLSGPIGYPALSYHLTPDERSRSADKPLQVVNMGESSFSCYTYKYKLVSFPFLDFEWIDECIGFTQWYMYFIIFFFCLSSFFGTLKILVFLKLMIVLSCVSKLRLVGNYGLWTWRCWMLKITYTYTIGKNVCFYEKPSYNFILTVLFWFCDFVFIYIRLIIN